MRSQIKNKKRYLKGYDFAAGCLLRGTRKDLQDLDSPARYIDRDDFDFGVEQAIRDWEDKTK